MDVEEWFHILELRAGPDLKQWETLESRIEKNFYFLLNTIEKYRAKATFFFLGWIAEKYPRLVTEAHTKGHEIASHGYSHQLIFTQTKEQFRNDIRKSKDILETIINEPVNGYRAPGFSVTNDTLWALEELVAAGYTYDSSIFPTSRAHGGIRGAKMDPYILHLKPGKIIEFPMSVAQYLGKRICFFGGGYMRLFPYFLIKKMGKHVNRGGRPIIIYLHPREIDPHHPRIKMNAFRYFKSYVNLSTTAAKFSRILEDHELTSFRQWISLHEIKTIDSHVA